MKEEQIMNIELEINNIYEKMRWLEYEIEDGWKWHYLIKITEAQEKWKMYDSELKGFEKALNILGYVMSWNPIESRYAVVIDWKKISD